MMRIEARTVKVMRSLAGGILKKATGFCSGKTN